VPDDGQESSVVCQKKTCRVKKEDCSGKDKVILRECKVYMSYNNKDCEEIVFTETDIENNKCDQDTGVSVECNGCSIDKTTCIPFGSRLLKKDTAYYCDLSKVMLNQKENQATCQNSYECISNNCKGSLCAPICEGCLDKGNMCIPFGTRVDASYCGLKYSFENQLNEEEKCSNNYECSTNLCVNSTCVSQSLIQKIMDWFKGIFN
jgi:hypothetical protein